MKKVAIISSLSTQSIWQSCQHISPNIVKTYESTSNIKIDYFDYKDSFNEYKTLLLGKK